MQIKDADYLTTWYSGWYNGLAKRRVDLAPLPVSAYLRLTKLEVPGPLDHGRKAQLDTPSADLQPRPSADEGARNVHKRKSN
jgi:hypothetical protein